MFSLKITRWLRGYVRFSVLGGSPERFFNSCARAGAYLWDISSRRDSGACIAVGWYRLLRPYARRAGCRLRVRERHGLPFLLYRTRNHRGLFAGAAAAAVILGLLSMHVWCIEVSGNETLDTQAILSALAENGLYPGAMKSEVNSGRAEQRLMLMFPKISWMSVNTRDCVLDVQIQEKTDRPEIVRQDGACDVKASETGQILSLRVYGGTAVVKVGDAVVRGQLLVSAVVEDQLGGSTMKHASAEIIAETSHTCRVQIPLERSEREPTGQTAVRRSLGLFGARLPLTFVGRPKGDYEVSGLRTDVRLFGTLLPVSVFEEDWTEMRTVPVRVSREQALAAAREKVEGYKRNLPQVTKVLSVEESEETDGKTLQYTAVLRCEENIAKESEILIKS